VLPLKRPDQTSYRAHCRSSRSNLRTISVPQHGSQKTVPQRHGAAPIFMIRAVVKTWKTS